MNSAVRTHVDSIFKSILKMPLTVGWKGLVGARWSSLWPCTVIEPQPQTPQSPEARHTCPYASKPAQIYHIELVFPLLQNQLYVMSSGPKS